MYKSLIHKIKNHSVFRIVCVPSSGSIELYLTEITRSGSQMFVVCLVSVWQRNFEPVVCVYGTMGWELVPGPSYHTHTLLVQNSLPNTDQAHNSTTGWELVPGPSYCTHTTGSKFAAKLRPSTRQTSVNHYE